LPRFLFRRSPNVRFYEAKNYHFTTKRAARECFHVFTQTLFVENGFLCFVDLIHKLTYPAGTEQQRAKLDLASLPTPIPEKNTKSFSLFTRSLSHFLDPAPIIFNKLSESERGKKLPKKSLNRIEMRRARCLMIFSWMETMAKNERAM
jgi:hypothetical protein